MKRQKLAAVLVAIGCIHGAAVPAAAGNAVRDLVAKFEKEDPGWKVRMESLVRIARAGPAAVPVLTERLLNGPPAAREFSAQALAVLADPGARPALVAAIKDPSPQVRVYAVCGLGALEKTPASTELLHAAATGDAAWSVRHAAAWAFERDDSGGTAEIARALGRYELNDMDTARLDMPAPDFSLTDLDGKIHRLADFRGRKSVILKFYQEPL